jgi:hypothetical protein
MLRCNTDVPVEHFSENQGGSMASAVDRQVREEIVSRATAMAQSGRYARCIDIEAALIPQFGYQALRGDFRSPTFQNDIERICHEATKRERRD